MQTFLPYSSFKASAACLDNKRLGKQRVEAMQILHTLRAGGGWASHPAVKMWRGCEEALIKYYNCCIEEWEKRGYQNIKLSWLSEKGGYISYPIWLGDAAFHRSHQSNLLRKLPEHYNKFFNNVPNNLPYVWPN